MTNANVEKGRKKKNTKKESYTEVNNYEKKSKRRGIKEFLQKLY